MGFWQRVKESKCKTCERNQIHQGAGNQQEALAGEMESDEAQEAAREAEVGGWGKFRELWSCFSQLHTELVLTASSWPWHYPAGQDTLNSVQKLRADCLQSCYQPGKNISFRWQPLSPASAQVTPTSIPWLQLVMCRRQEQPWGNNTGARHF